MVYAFRLFYFYIRHFITSIQLQGIHSPFVFQLYNQVICHTGTYSQFPIIENLRRSLYRNRKLIKVTDWGAGSQVKNTKEKRISQLARSAAVPPKLAQFLFRLINFQQPTIILEIGTSLGLTTAYLASARKQAVVYTLEGCPETALVAQLNFKKLQLKNITPVTGNFEYTLPAVLQEINRVDFVLFDGNHRYEPTMRYFEWCLTKKSEESIFVFDDIYWSAEMRRAWCQICLHPEVLISIDLFFIGLVFFRKNQPKQHFSIRL